MPKPTEPQPWHEADEPGKQPGRATSRGEPTGTHSFTGGSASVGIPGPATPAGDAEPGAKPEREARDGTASAAEPRAGAADLLGRKPDERGQ